MRGSSAASPHSAVNTQQVQRDVDVAQDCRNLRGLVGGCTAMRDAIRDGIEQFRKVLDDRNTVRRLGGAAATRALAKAHATLARPWLENSPTRSPLTTAHHRSPTACSSRRRPADETRTWRSRFATSLHPPALTARPTAAAVLRAARQGGGGDDE